MKGRLKWKVLQEQFTLMITIVRLFPFHYDKTPPSLGPCRTFSYDSFSSWDCSGLDKCTCRLIMILLMTVLMDFLCGLFIWFSTKSIPHTEENVSCWSCSVWSWNLRPFPWSCSNSEDKVLSNRKKKFYCFAMGLLSKRLWFLIVKGHCGLLKRGYKG